MKEGRKEGREEGRKERREEVKGNNSRFVDLFRLCRQRISPTNVYAVKEITYWPVIRPKTAPYKFAHNSLLVYTSAALLVIHSAGGGEFQA